MNGKICFEVDIAIKAKKGFCDIVIVMCRQITFNAWNKRSRSVRMRVMRAEENNSRLNIWNSVYKTQTSIETGTHQLLYNEVD